MLTRPRIADATFRRESMPPFDRSRRLMPAFAYTARDAAGAVLSGTIDAAAERDALTALAGRGLFPTSVDLAESAKSKAKAGTRRVSAKHLTQFYGQLADLLKSGVPLLRSIELLERKSGVPALQSVLEDVRGEVADGNRLADAMRRHPKAFSELAVSMVTAGEEGGFLEDVLKRIASFTEHQQELRGKVVGAMVYPAFLLVMGGGDRGGDGRLLRAEVRPHLRPHGRHRRPAGGDDDPDEHQRRGAGLRPVDRPRRRRGPVRARQVRHGDRGGPAAVRQVCGCSA